MGGARDNVLVVDSIASPRRAAIERAQTELSQEYDVREQRRRELEFLEKGGNPLDFKFEPTSAISLQSTSVNDQPAENCLTSEAKDSFALVASPNGDSAESSGRPGTCLGREPHTADNLLFFDAENDVLIGERNGIRSNKRGKFPAAEQYSQTGSGYFKNMEDLLVCRPGVKRQHYARRNRSRPSRDVTHASSADIAQTCIPNGNATLASSQDLSDEKSPPVELTKDKDENTCCISHLNLKSSDHIFNGFLQNVASTSQSDMEVDTMRSQEADIPAHGSLEDKKEIAEPESPPEQEIFLDSEEAFAEKESDVVGFVTSIQDDKKEDGSLVPLSDGTTSIPNVEAEKVSVICEGSSALLMDDDHRGNGERISSELVTADDQSSVMKGDVDSNAIADKHLDLLEKSLLSDSVGNKEDVKCDPSDLHKKDLQGVETNIMDVDGQVKVEEEVCDSRTGMPNDEEPFNNIAAGKPESLPDKDVEKLDNRLSDTSNSKHENLHSEVRTLDNFVSSSCAPEVADPMEVCSRAGNLPENGNNKEELENKTSQDISAEEARAIKVTLKRGLAGHTRPVEWRKTRWDFVLEEMAWLANDFMQERMWKIAVAAQVCRWVAHGDSRVGKMRRVARSLAISVMDFWQSAKTRLQDGKPTSNLHEGGDANGLLDNNSSSTLDDSMEGEKRTQSQEHINDPVVNHTKRKSLLPLLDYAVRFLKYDQSLGLSLQAEAPATPAKEDAAILEADEFSEVNLFYRVPPGAMDTYRGSFESLWASNEKCDTGINRDECDTSFSVDPARAQEADFEDDDFEIGSRYLPGALEGRKLKFAHKRRKNLQKSHGIRSYKLKAMSGMGFGNYMDGRFENPTGKRDSCGLNVGLIPTKRVRTAARQRIISPFSAGVAGGMHRINKNDVSSGDTSSFQDDLSSLHIGSHPKKNSEVESTCEFVKQVPLETSVVSTKMKKKKAKPTGCRTFLTSTEPAGFAASGKGADYEKRWQTDQVHQYEQKDQFKKRSEGHSLEPNGNTGLHGQHATKRLKVSKQLPDNTAEASTPLTGSLPSPAASQMSNIANPNKLMKMIMNRERGRKNKVLKISAGQSGEGVPWTLFEDQALVVLVHDLGPNWELVSDAINSTLLFKCIFRRPKECKERHKALMDKNTGDGADSAEDSGTSQPYPSTLPGIPKGSARQLFKRLQEPLEDDILKAHFEKIIMIGSKHHCHKIKSESQEPMQPTPTHSSHSIALSQTCTTNLSGGLLTPLDLCETTSSPDALSPSYPVSHSPGLPLPSHQGAVAPMQSNSMGHMLQGSGTAVLGNTVPAPLGQTSRDLQRPATAKSMALSLDDQRRMQQFNQMVSNRNIQQSGLSMNAGMQAGGDRVRMMPGGNGVGIMPGMSRGMPMPMPGYQGMGSPSILNMVYSGVVPGHGNTIPRPREALQMMRPGQPSDDQRQMLMQDLQLQVPQGNGQPMPSFNSLNTPSSNQMVSSPVQAFPVQHPQVPQQSHGINNSHHSQIQNSNSNTQQQAYMYRLAKDRQYQQRLLQQQQQQHHHQHLAPNMSLPHAQQQHAMSPVPNGSSQPQAQAQQQAPPQHQQHSLHINQQQTVAQSAPASSILLLNQISLQGAQKQHIGLPHAASGMNPPAAAGIGTPNQVMKQRQRQQMPQQHRQQGQGQQPRQHPQAQQAKVLKGSGRGNAVGVSPPEEGSYASGPPLPGNQVVDKGDQLMHMMHGQRLLPGAIASQAPCGKQAMLSGASGYHNQTNVHLSQASSAQSQQQKLYSRPVPPSRQSSQLSSSLSDAGNTTIPGLVCVPNNPSSLPLSQQVAAVAQHPATSASVAISANSPPVSSPSPQHQHHQQQQLLKPDQQHQQRHTIQSQQPIQRRLQNHQLLANSVAQSVDRSASQITNQFEASSNTNHPSSADSALVVSAVPSATMSQWAPEQLDATSPPSSTGHVAATNPSGSELPLSGSSALPQTHYSGSVSTHGHNVGNNQWHQQPVPLSRLQSPLAPQQQSRAVAQSAPQQHSNGLGGIYGSLPSSGPP